VARVKGSSYKSVFFDFDGVVSDTNALKKTNIFSSVSEYLEPRLAEEFSAFFTANNGIPREQKVFSWFSRAEAEEILKNYARRNQEAFRCVGTTPGFRQFLKHCLATDTRTWVLSGGDSGEIRAILRRNAVEGLDGILAGPATKHDNLSRLSYPEPAVFIGDSRHDYEVALEFGLDFVFMSGYTQFTEWRTYFHDKTINGTISDFGELL